MGGFVSFVTLLYCKFYSQAKKKNSVSVYQQLNPANNEIFISQPAGYYLPGPGIPAQNSNPVQIPNNPVGYSSNQYYPGVPYNPEGSEAYSHLGNHPNNPHSPK